MVLGLHDALVSQTGIIVGLTFALANNHLIILTSIISAVAAGLSMTASNYLASRADGHPRAIVAGLYTGGAYLTTSAALVTPFALISDQFFALATTAAIVVLVIFLFNFAAYGTRRKPFMRHFAEMLIICIIVSVIAFAIGGIAKHFLGVEL